MGACCCCCRPGRYDTPGAGKKGRVGDKRVRERFAIMEGAYHVKLPFEKNVTINSAAFLPTGDVVLADSINKKLKLYNCNFEFLSCMEFPTPVHHVVSSPNHPLLYATFPDRVRQIHVEGSQMKRSGFIKTPATCRGICINRYEGKAIALHMDDGIGQVNLLTPGGNLQLELDDDDDGFPMFIEPEHVIVTRDLNILVTDTGRRCVLGVSPEGDQLFCYTGIRVPQALVVDERNYIYVAGPTSIHQLNEKGELVKFFLSRAEIGFSPLSLCYNPDRKLLLATGKGSKIVLFKMID